MQLRYIKHEIITYSLHTQNRGEGIKSETSVHRREKYTFFHVLTYATNITITWKY